MQWQIKGLRVLQFISRRNQVHFVIAGAMNQAKHNHVRTGHTKAPVGVNIFWDLLVWLLKGHLALKAKAKASLGFHTKLCYVYLCKLIASTTTTKRWKKSLITALATPATVNTSHYEFTLFEPHTQILSIWGPLENMKKSFGSEWHTWKLQLEP